MDRAQTVELGSGRARNPIPFPRVRRRLGAPDSRRSATPARLDVTPRHAMMAYGMSVLLPGLNQRHIKHKRRTGAGRAQAAQMQAGCRLPEH